MPLTSITAWEALFDRMDIRKPVAGAAPSVLIIGGAGGVSSIAIQLVRGAHHVIDHGKPIAEQVLAQGIGAPGFVFSTTHTADHLKEIVELIAPARADQQRAARTCIVDAQVRVDPLGIDVHALDDANRRHGGVHALLDNVARLVDAGKIRSTIAEHFGAINAANLKRAHALIETGKARGKIVLEGL